MARAIKHFCLLPPGRLAPYDFGMHTDPLFCTKKAEAFGPIFKLIWSGRYTTCLIGHGRAREFLLAHEDELPGATIELRGLFPKGHLRAMSGEDHRKYRRLFVEALQATPLAFQRAPRMDFGEADRFSKGSGRNGNSWGTVAILPA